jgi:sulfur-oxidizing protein SoxX
MKFATAAAVSAFFAVLLLAACVAGLPDPDPERAAVAMLKSSFKTRGQASVERLNQDEVQALCSKFPSGPPKELAATIEKSQLATIRYPASGKLMGEWREGERVAQSGRGKQFTDDPKRPAGGNCYACHRLGSQEVSFGTIGPSLYRFGRQRGTGEAAQRYAYGKIYNSQAFSACSNMPRFGHNGILNEAQIAHLVALLLDPDSPVNK